MEKVINKIEDFIQDELAKSSFGNEECKEILESVQCSIAGWIDACEEGVYK